MWDLCRFSLGLDFLIDEEQYCFYCFNNCCSNLGSLRELCLPSLVTNCCINFPVLICQFWDSSPNTGFTCALFPDSTFSIAPSQMFMKYRFHWVITNVSTIWHTLSLSSSLSLYLPIFHHYFSPWLLCFPWLSMLETFQSCCYISETFLL